MIDQRVPFVLVSACGVGRDVAVHFLPERMIFGQGLGRGDIQPGRLQVAGAEGFREVVLIDRGSASDVVEERSGLHLGEELGIDKIPRGLVFGEDVDDMIGGGQPQMPGGELAQMPQAAMQPQMGAPEQKKPGFFQSDAGRAAIGTFADTLVKLRSGVDPGIMQNFQRQQQMQAQQQRDEAQRYAGLEDYGKRKEIDKQYDTPNPKYWESNDGSLMQLDANGQPQVVYKDPNEPLVQRWDGSYGSKQFQPRSYGAELPPGIELDVKGGPASQSPDNF